MRHSPGKASRWFPGKMSVGRTWFRAEDMTVRRLRVKELKWQPLASSRPRQCATDRLAYRPPNRVVTASYILATKLEAFAGRGGDEVIRNLLFGAARRFGRRPRRYPQGPPAPRLARTPRVRQGWGGLSDTPDAGVKGKDGTALGWPRRSPGGRRGGSRSHGAASTPDLITHPWKGD
jgi:hypothetical protein